MILVIGQPRTGTSLCMQMLAAADVHCTGSPPGYEDARGKTGDVRSVGAHEAVKIVWHSGMVGRVELPPGARAIVTDRAADEQIKSEWKFVQIMHFGVDPSDWIPATTGHMIKARPAFKRYRYQIGQAVASIPTMDLQFEDLLHDPRFWARKMAEFIGASSPQNVERMAAVVKPRPPCCLQTLLELELFNEQMGAGAPAL